MHLRGLYGFPIPVLRDMAEQARKQNKQTRRSALMRIGGFAFGSGALYSVAAMTALMVCIRFSASSKTMDREPSNTSSVTSMAVKPY